MHKTFSSSNKKKTKQNYQQWGGEVAQSMIPNQMGIEIDTFAGKKKIYFLNHSISGYINHTLEACALEWLANTEKNAKVFIFLKFCYFFVLLI